MTFQRFATLVLLIVASWLGYYLYGVHYAQQDEQIEPDAEKPLFAGENVKSTSYDTAGKRSYSIKSTSLEYYSKLGETHFNEPVLWTFKDGDDEEWRISANFAVLKDKNILEMKGRVRIFNLLPESSIKTISTETLTLDLTSQDFWSDSDIEITGEGFQTSAKRAKGNFGSYKMDLTGTVKSRYEPNILSSL
ncbi:LPS export ABC transporter periplasmic protein LptC [Veronia pacifica]|uniref:Lipopolysaccharide export system protein LptC n=1 Tax=Veronia pacifica TaxID=1080227 RepID=A0A1C3ELL5_9GAMM|nr:LPS export ABC transporter periplasmic protein LptC [Veronia pacifica]ODA34122.1 LPS export ABC transporter periplasmic protein LptC [Veronia pacifica]